MKLKNAIDTAVSHNALVVLEETDPKDSHYSVSIYEGMAHEIPNELLEREMFPITDIVGDRIGRLHIHLKLILKLLMNFYYLLNFHVLQQKKNLTIL